MASCATVYQVPGPKGATGAAGTNGTDGVNAFSTLALAFDVPSGEDISPSVSHESDGTDATVIMGVAHYLSVGTVVDVDTFTDAAFNLNGAVVLTIPDAFTFTYACGAAAGGVVADVNGVLSDIRVMATLVDASWVVIGQFVEVESVGTFEVMDVVGNVVYLRNPYDGSSGSYPNNVIPGVTATVGLKVGPAGMQGGQGTAGVSGAPVDAQYWVAAADGTLTNERVLPGSAGYVKTVDAVGTPGIQAVPIPIADGGTAAVTAVTAFNALSPVTTRGDVIVRGAANNERLAVGAADTVLRSDGTDPLWGKVVLTMDVTGVLPAANGGTGGSSTYPFSAYIGIGGQVIPGIPVTIIFDTELFDPDGVYNAATGVFTAAVTGKYQFNVKLQTAGAANYFFLRVNGSSVSELGFTLSVMTVSVLIDLVATDTVDIYGTPGLADTVLGAVNYPPVVARSEFSGFLT